MILKSAINQSNFSQNLQFCRNARTAWYYIILNIQNLVGRIPKVLLPAYIGFTDREGSGVFDPIKESGASYCFYGVGSSFELNLSELEKYLSSDDIDILLVIHYFGFCRNDMNSIRRLCKEAGVFLVEDCAHAFHLASDQPLLGSLGDFSFFSLHKYLAVKSGGVLKINIQGFNPLPIKEVDMADYIVLEQFIKTNFKDVAQVRRENYKSYESLLPDSPLLEPIHTLENSDVPQSYAIRVKGGLREKLYFYLMDKDIPTTSLYYRMIDELSIDQFPVSFSISNEILNFPVHQDTTVEDVNLICEEVRNFLESCK